MTLQVALPGAEPQRWSIPVTGGQAAEVAMSATSSQLSRSRLIPLVLGVALIVLAAVAAVVALVRRRR
jgi:cobalamin biosynthesis Mg chelatase CobN